MSFIKRCADKLDDIEFVDRDSDAVYAQISHGKLIWWDQTYVAALNQAGSVYRTLQALGYNEEQRCGSRQTRTDSISDSYRGYRLGQ